MPAILIALCVFGLVPLVFFAFGAVGQNPETAEGTLVSLIDYAALVLGFAGGVHWGLALVPGAISSSARFAAGVLPLVVAWAALVLAQMVAPSVALAVLILGYLATVMTEQRVARRLLVPSHYLWLRWGFSVVAIAMMGMVLLLRGVGQTIVL